MENKNEILMSAINQMLEGLNLITQAAEDLKNTLEDTPEEVVTEKTYTFQEVRGIMADLVAGGKKEEARKLLEEFGASKLSEVAETDYAALAAKAEVMIDG